MKSCIALCLTIVFVSANTFFLAAATPVLDVNGNELQARRGYYVVSAIQGLGGGDLTLSFFRNPTCPTTVIQAYRLGLPVIFHNFDSKNATIHISSSLNAKFDVRLPCANSTVWQYGNFYPGLRSNVLEIGGEQGQCNNFNCFKIKEVTPNATYIISTNEGGSYLGLVNGIGPSVVAVSSGLSPLKVVFVKAYDKEINSII